MTEWGNAGMFGIYEEKSPKQNVYSRLKAYLLKRSKAIFSTQSEVCKFTRNNTDVVDCGNGIFFGKWVGLKNCAVFICGNLPRRKAVRNPEGFPASNINAADCYESNLSATAEMINTSSARGTAALTLKVKPSRFTCVNISTEISEVLFSFIATTPKDPGSTVTSSWAVAVCGADIGSRTAFCPYLDSPARIPCRQRISQLLCSLRRLQKFHEKKSFFCLSRAEHSTRNVVSAIAGYCRCKPIFCLD